MKLELIEETYAEDLVLKTRYIIREREDESSFGSCRGVYSTLENAELAMQSIIDLKSQEKRTILKTIDL